MSRSKRRQAAERHAIPAAAMRGVLQARARAPALGAPRTRLFARRYSGSGTVLVVDTLVVSEGLWLVVFSGDES